MLPLTHGKGGQTGKSMYTIKQFHRKSRNPEIHEYPWVSILPSTTTRKEPVPAKPQNNNWVFAWAVFTPPPQTPDLCSSAKGKIYWRPPPPPLDATSPADGNPYSIQQAADQLHMQHIDASSFIIEKKKNRNSHCGLCRPTTHRFTTSLWRTPNTQERRAKRSHFPVGTPGIKPDTPNCVEIYFTPPCSSGLIARPKRQTRHLLCGGSGNKTRIFWGRLLWRASKMTHAPTIHRQHANHI